MDWYSTVFEVIDLRSFSNLWFWIALAVLWSSVSHWVIGIPFDMVGRARRMGGQAAQDLEDIARVNSNRILFIFDEAGLWMVGIGSALLSALFILGFVFQVEIAQAVFLLGFPLAIVGALSIHSARCILNGENSGEALWRRMRMHRSATQVIGMASIFVTSLWGMHQNLTAAIF